MLQSNSHGISSRIGDIMKLCCELMSMKISFPLNSGIAGKSTLLTKFFAACRVFFLTLYVCSPLPSLGYKQAC